MRKTYYLPPTKYYYDYTIEGCCPVYTLNTKGLYTSAYSLAQARYQFIMRISQYAGVDTHDIEIDSSDIVELSHDTK